MKSRIVLLFAGIVLAGCAGNGDLLKRANSPERSNVFTVVTTATPPERGFADLTIRASVKTHRAALFPLGRDPHDTPDYQLLVNIDGEPYRISGSPGIRETFFDGRCAGNPERFPVYIDQQLVAGCPVRVITQREECGAMGLDRGPDG